MAEERGMGKWRGGIVPGLALACLMWLGEGPAWAQPSPPPGGPISVRPALRSEAGSQPRVVTQTVPDAQVSAIVLAIRYRAPGEAGASPSAAHLLEHLLFRSRPGSPPGGLLLRSEGFGGQSLAYVRSGVIVLGEVVPADQGLQSLDLQLERLRTVPSDVAELNLEKQAIAREIVAAGKSPEEAARRQLLLGLGVDAGVEGEAEALAAVSAKDLDALLAGLSLETEVVIAVVGPHSERDVRQHLSQTLSVLRPSRAEPRPKLERASTKAPGPEDFVVSSSSGWNQQSFFLSLPDLSVAELMTAKELLEEAAGSSRMALSKEDRGLYRLDVSPPPSSASALARRLVEGSLGGEALAAKIQRAWLDRFEQPLERAEMLALETLDLDSVSTPPAAVDVVAWRDRLASGLGGALEKAPSLRLVPKGAGSVDGLYPFQQTAKAGERAELQRQTLSNGLTVAWQPLRSWPIVAVSGFFRLRRPLTPSECSRLEAKLEARSEAGLDYEVRPDVLFFHTWCPSGELTATLASSASEIRRLSESAEVLVERGLDSTLSPLDEFFLNGAESEASSPISGRSLLWPEGGQLVVVGDVDPTALDLGLRPAWNGWFADKPPRPAATKGPKMGLGETSRTLDLPAGEAPLLILGVWGPSRATPDFLAFNLVMQTMAGRPTSSLLARQLRDNEGSVETVSVFPMAGSERPDGRQLWLIAMRPRNLLSDATPLAAKVESRLGALTRDVLTDAELERTRRYLKGALKISTATPRGRARVLANSEFYRLSDQYSLDYAGMYDRIDAGQARAVCQKYLAEPARWLYFRPAGAPSEG